MKALKRIIRSRKVRASRAGITHVTLNAAVPSLDMATDLVNAIDLINHGHINWGSASLLLIFLPFLMKVGMVAPVLLRGKTNKRHNASLVFSLPFVNPIKQLLLGIRLALLNLTKKNKSKQIEDIKRDSSQTSFYESILEAGPQLLLQCHIVLSTGQISNLQAVSMTSSVLTLTLAAARGFYMQRSREFSDPEPSLQAVFWVFLPMFILVVNAITSWTVIGVVKEFLLLVLFLGVSLTWTILWLVKKLRKEAFKTPIIRDEKAEGKNEIDEVDHERECIHEDEIYDRASLFTAMSHFCKSSFLLCFHGLFCICRATSRQKAFFGNPLEAVGGGKEQAQLYQKYRRNQTYNAQARKHFMELTQQLLNMTRTPAGLSEDEEFFLLKSAVCSQWVPCIVGDFRDRTLLISAWTSFTTRSIALVTVLLMAAFGFPESLQTRTTLLFCHDTETLTTLQLTNTCVGLGCFAQPSHSISHMYRICQSGETTFAIVGIIFLITLNALSLLAILWLHYTSNYANLYKVSTCWPAFFPCQRLAHRSLVMKYIEQGNADKLEEVLIESPLDAGSRRNGDGTSPVEAAIASGQGECLRKLIQAKVEMPEIRAHIASIDSENAVVFHNDIGTLRLKDLDLDDIQVLQNECKVTKVKRKMGTRAL